MVTTMKTTHYLGSFHIGAEVTDHDSAYVWAEVSIRDTSEIPSPVVTGTVQLRRDGECSQLRATQVGMKRFWFAASTKARQSHWLMHSCGSAPCIGTRLQSYSGKMIRTSVYHGYHRWKVNTCYHFWRQLECHDQAFGNEVCHRNWIEMSNQCCIRALLLNSRE